MSLFWVIIITLLSVGRARNEQSNQREFKDLLETERILINHLHKYGNVLKGKLSSIRRGIESIVAERSWSIDTQKEYLANPVNAFKLIRRLHVDWRRWIMFMQQHNAEAIEKIKEYRSHLPSSGDLKKAINKIHQLTTTNGLMVLDMVHELNKNTHFNVYMSSLECATIGFELFSQAQYNDSLNWLISSTMMYVTNDILHLMQLNPSKLANAQIKTLLHMNATVLAEELSKIRNKAESRLYSINMPKEEAFTEPPITPESLIEDKEEENYVRGCRGEFSHQVSRMYCLYNTTTTPFLKLAPLKLEIITLNPYIVVFHDVIYDNEIEELKQLARLNLHPALVLGTEKIEADPDRSAKEYTMWAESLINDRINQRISDMTGFDINGSEPSQIVNYGVGGYYTTHYDHLNSDLGLGLGNRIATVIFYLSDVEGGLTVFPKIQKAITPKKGSALMWYNMDNTMTLDRLTYHAGCPVLLGSKWVLCKWIDDRNQIFRRPCYP